MTKRDIAHVPRATLRYRDALFRSYHSGTMVAKRIKALQQLVFRNGGPADM